MGEAGGFGGSGGGARRPGASSSATSASFPRAYRRGPRKAPIRCVPWNVGRNSGPPAVVGDVAARFDHRLPAPPQLFQPPGNASPPHAHRSVDLAGRRRMYPDLNVAVPFPSTRNLCSGSGPGGLTRLLKHSRARTPPSELGAFGFELVDSPSHKAWRRCGCGGGPGQARRTGFVVLVGHEKSAAWTAAPRALRQFHPTSRSAARPSFGDRTGRMSGACRGG